MNRGALNGHAVNARGLRRGVIRIAADLIGEAFLVSKARVIRYLTGPLEVEARIGQGGRRWARSPTTAVGEASVGLTAIPILRGVFNATCEATVSVAAKVGRRSVFIFEAVSQISLAAYVILRGAAHFDGRANVPADLTVWKLSPESVPGAAVVTLKAGVRNNFPYDEDAPEERVFIVPPEDNVFYVVV